MKLVLFLHPLASFCHKVLIALYENGTEFEPRIVDFADEAQSAELETAWPIGTIPVLRDGTRTVPETSIIIEYLDRHYPGAVPLIPAEPEAALQARLWDRFFDLYVSVPMQKIVTDRLRPTGKQDPHGVEEAKATLRTAYSMVEQRRLDTDRFTIADCSAAPALFYAEAVLPFSRDYPRTEAYFRRLVERPSYRRVLAEAQPYFGLFPYREGLPKL